jgi:hypothetical protein
MIFHFALLCLLVSVLTSCDAFPAFENPRTFSSRLYEEDTVATLSFKQPKLCDPTVVQVAYPLLDQKERGVEEKGAGDRPTYHSYLTLFFSFSISLSCLSTFLVFRLHWCWYRWALLFLVFRKPTQPRHGWPDPLAQWRGKIAKHSRGDII